MKYMKVSRLSMKVTGLIFSITLLLWSEFPDNDLMSGVFIFEDYWTAHTDEPTSSFYKAEQYFQEKNYPECSKLIMKAATFTLLEQSRSKKPHTKQLRIISADLKKLATAVRKGSVKNLSRLHQSFVKTEYLIAMHHSIRADFYLKNNDYADAGISLDASLNHIKQAWLWTSEYLTVEDKKLYDKVSNAAKELTEHGKFANMKKINLAYIDLNKLLKTLRTHRYFLKDKNKIIK